MPLRGNPGFLSRLNPLISSILRLRTFLALGVLVGGFAGCLSSDSSVGSSGSAFGNNGEEFGLALCSLGCSGGNCTVNSIATNQDIVLTFNDFVDPASVHNGTIQVIDIANGSSPPIHLLTNGDQVILRPALVESGYGIQFGFEEGAQLSD